VLLINQKDDAAWLSTAFTDLPGTYFRGSAQRVDKAGAY